MRAKFGKNRKLSLFEAAAKRFGKTDLCHRIVPGPINLIIFP